jgi:probable HAF family extracellular repeat protein
MPNWLFALGVALCGAASAPAETYTLTQINPPAGAESGSAASVNNLGQIVGNTSVKAGRSIVPGPAFVWANGAAVSLPSPGSDSAAHANAISDSGLIVGHSTAPRAVWWQAAVGGGYAVGNWNDLLPAGSPLFLADAVAVSQDGQFVVFDAMNTVSGLYAPAVARVEAGTITPWSIDTGGNPAMPLFDCLASDIHHDGTTVRVVGFYARSQNDTPHAFLWQRDLASGATSMIDLDNQNAGSLAQGVNASGEVAGNINIAGVYQAYFWNASGVKQQLGTLGGARSYAASINDAGTVTGWSARSGKNATAHAFLWSLSTGIRDLNSLKSASDTSGIELTSALKVNNAGQVLARGTRKSVGVDVLLKRVP